MKCFEFSGNDQSRNNWLVNTELKEPPWVVTKPKYAPCFCPKCELPDLDALFELGFDDTVKIRARGDLFHSSDGFVCVNEKVKALVESEGFRGVAFKPVGKAGWWVVNVTRRVEGDEQAYTRRNICPECGRARQTYGQICCVNQIDCPKEPGTFFSPKFRRSGYQDRDLFVTEDIVASFKKNGVKGGLFSRLLEPAEFEAVKAANALMDPLRWPKDSKVIL
jgi:hypothetical protein